MISSIGMNMSFMFQYMVLLQNSKVQYAQYDQSVGHEIFCFLILQQIKWSNYVQSTKEEQN